jgi:hypothetical protein
VGVSDSPGVHLVRTEENVDEIEALAARLGGRVGLPALLRDLNRRARRTFAPGRAVRRALTWDADDRRDPRWWPQGVSTSADASDTEDVEGRRMLVVSWYAKSLPGQPGEKQGSRLTFLDLATRRYRHVLLVNPVVRDGVLTLEPLRVHAGGVVWCGPYLHIAATSRGVITCRVDDLLRVPDSALGDGRRLGLEADRVSSYGYRYVLPVRFSYRAVTDDGLERLRYSFLSLDRGVSPPELVVGEYGNSAQTRRLARFPLDPETLFLAEGEDGVSRPLLLDDGGVVRTQGAAIAHGRWYLTRSTGPWVPGSVYVGQPGAFRRYRWATPMGPEDIAWWPSTDLLWSVTEHPRRRWVYAMNRSWFDRRSGVE